MLEGGILLDDNAWYRIVYTFKKNGSAGDYKAYVNGVEDTAGNFPSEGSGTYTSANFNKIGTTGGTSRFFNGMMSNYQIWDSAWSADDVTYDYLNPEQLALNRGGTSLTESNLKLWYPMQDGHRGQQSFVLDGSNTGLGEEMISNGDFSVTGDWAYQTGWAYDTDKATFTAGGSDNGLRIIVGDMISAVEVSTTYKLVFTISTATAEFGLYDYGNSTEFIAKATYAVGTHTLYFNTPSSIASGGISFYAESDGNTFSIDDISVKPVNAKNHATTVFLGDELIGEDNNREFNSHVGVDWTELDTSGSDVAVEINNEDTTGQVNKMQITTTTDDEVEGATLPIVHVGNGTATSIVAGRTYRVSAEISVASGTPAIDYMLGGTTSGNFSINSTPTYKIQDIVPVNATDPLQIRTSGDTTARVITVDNFSVKEVGTATGWTDADQQLDIPQTALQSYNQLAWFDQDNDTVIIADTTNDNDDIFDGGGSISAWIYPIDLGENNYGRIVDKSSSSGGAEGYFLALYSESGATSNIQFARGHDNTDGSWTFDARYITYGEWQHIVVVYDDDSTSNDPTIYLNGASMTITETATPVGNEETDASQALTIGNRSGGTDRTFAGCITEVSMWGTELSLAEVQELYNDGKALDATTHSEKTNLKGYWRNNGLAVWQDLTANNNDATPTSLTETLLIPAGVDGSRDNQGFLMNRQRATNALNLTGGEDYVYCYERPSFRITGALTLEAWVKTTDNDVYIIGRDDATVRAYYFAIIGNKTRLYVNDSSSESFDDGATSVNDGSWHHLVGVYVPSTSITIYVDGESDGVNTSSIISEIRASDEEVYIGVKGNLDSTKFLDGQIDDVRIYSKALSAAEITRNYNAGKRSHRNG
jgi:hypothetical protein